MTGELITIADPKDHDRIQNALPGYMFALLFDSLRQKLNLEVRADLEELANKSSAAALQDTVAHHMVRLCKEVEKVGYSALGAAGTDDLRLLIGGCAHAFVKIQADGIGVNPDAVLVALGIAAEVDDGITDWGTRNQIMPVAVRIANDLQRAGYFKDDDAKLIARQGKTT